MHPDQYDADAICRAMGLHSFVEREGSRSTLRTLLKPAFHPEVCLTFSHDDVAAELSVVALAESLRGSSFAPRFAVDSERIVLSSRDVGEAQRLFDAVLADAGAARFDCADGMGVECCRVVAGAVERWRGHAARASVRDLAKHFVVLGWNGASHSLMRDALADCAAYLGLELPKQSPLRAARPTRLLVTGTKEDRAELLSRLAHESDRRRRPEAPSP